MAARSNAQFCSAVCRALEHREKYKRAETFSEAAQRHWEILKRNFPDAANYIDHVRVTHGIKEGYEALKVVWEATKSAYDRGLKHRATTS